MTVSVPGTYSTGTITATAEIANATINVMEAALVAFEARSNGDPSWALYEDLSGVAPDQDVVYRSIGDPALGAGGDRKIYVSFERTSATAFNVIAYLDWSTNSSTGRNGQTSSWTIPTAATNITYHAWVNEYGAMFVFNQSSTWRVVLFGHPVRTHVPRNHQGTCFSTGAATAGASVAIPVDRDMREDLEVGLTIDIIPQAVDAGALPTFLPERCVIEAVSATHVTVETLVNNQPAGCCIGDDPVATYVLNQAGVATANTLLFCLNRALSATATATPQRTMAYTETDSDPDAAGTWHGMRLQLGGGSGAEWRGSAYHAGIWPTNGTQSPTRRFRNDFNDLDVWIQFPAIGAPGSYILCGRESSPGAGQVLFDRYGSEFDLLSGQITAGGTSKASELVLTIRTALTGTGFWQDYDESLLGGMPQYILRSTGADNDARVYFGLLAAASPSTTVTFTTFLDWAMNPQAIRNVQTRTQSLASNTTVIDWWIAYNEYAFTVIWRQSGSSWSIFSAGEPYRTHIQASHRGRCFSTGAVVAGSSVEISVDRDMRNRLVVGGEVDIVPLTEDNGDTLPTFVPERVTIEAIAEDSITVAVLANNQPIHCIIGDDPCPNQIVGSGPGGTVALINTSNFVIARAGSATATAPTIVESTLTEGDVDPDIASIFRGTRVGFQGLTNNHRGTLQSFAIWATNGTPVIEDTIFDYETGDAYRVFPAATSSGWILGLRSSVSGGATFIGHLLEQIIDQREQPRSGPTVDSIYDDGVFHGFLSSFEAPDPCREAEISTITATSSTNIRVVFAAPMIDSPPLSYTAAYEVSSGVGHAPEVLEVTPEAVANPTYVDLTVQEMRDGVTYDLTIHQIEESDPAGCNDPAIASVVATSSTVVRVTFQTAMVDDPLLYWSGSYAVSGGGHQPAILGVIPEDAVAPMYVDLIVEELRDGQVYDLTVYLLEEL